MGTLNLDKAQSVIEFALNWRKQNGLNPLTVAVLDSAGVVIALAREDGASNLRPEIAQG
ncbi:MAG: heme-binding protein, partial [Rhodobacteraceae bacterium]|nr:heme-binding protein [Paracoccaceae bacterium]